MSLIALSVFVVVVTVDVLTLGLDLILGSMGGYEATITASVRKRPLWALPLIGWQLLGGLALYVHFWP